MIRDLAPVRALRQVLRRLSFVTALLLAFTTLPTTGARAGLGDCVDALIETQDLAFYLVEQAAKLGACGDKLAANPALTAAVGALVATAYAAGGFSDEATCQGMVNTAIALALTKLIAESDLLKDAMVTVLGEGGVKELVVSVSDGAVGALEDVPPFAQIFGLMKCSCTVIGTVIGVKEQVQAIANDVKQCVEAGVAGVLNAGGYLHCNVFASGKCNQVEGPQQEFCEVNVNCLPGETQSACIARNRIAIANLPQLCYVYAYCPNPEPNKVWWETFQKLPGGSMNCACPAGQVFDRATAVDGLAGNEKCVTCQGDGKFLKDGFCEQWTCEDKSKLGLKFVGYGPEPGKDQCRYEPICKGNMVFNVGSKKCVPCGTNKEFAGYTGPGGIRNGGTCRECEYDEFSLAGETCKKLQCKGLEHADPDDPHKCVPCREIFNPGNVSLGGDLGQKFGNKAICLDLLDVEGSCSKGTIRFPDGECREAPPGVRVAVNAVKRKLPPKVDPGPVERIRNTAINPAPRAATPAVINQTAPTPRTRSLAPDLEFDGPGGGVRAPQGGTIRTTR